MAAEVDIVNRALARIGDAFITSLADNDKRATLARAVYGPVRDGEIAAHDWNFARQEATLAPLTQGPTGGRWRYRYEEPHDSLRLLAAGPWPAPAMGDLILAGGEAYSPEGGFILTNLGPGLYIRYLRRVLDVTRYPATFLDVLSARLAVEMCEPLTGSAQKRQLAWQEYERALRVARRANAFQRPPVPIEDGSWMVAHMEGVF